MAFQVRTAKTADAQIEAAYLWLKEYNPAYADQWFRGLMDTIASLQEKPRRCALALLAQCQKIAHLDGVITPQEAKVLETINTKLNRDLAAIK